jgi:hypothetical protein
MIDSLDPSPNCRGTTVGAGVDAKNTVTLCLRHSAQATYSDNQYNHFPTPRLVVCSFFSYNTPPCEAIMPFSIRPYRRLPVHSAVPYHADTFLKLPLAYFSVLDQLTASGLQRAHLTDLSRPSLYCLTPVRIAPRVMLSSVKLR